MGMFDRFIKNEERALENPIATLSVDDFLRIMGWGDFSSDGIVMVKIKHRIVN